MRDAFFQEYYESLFAGDDCAFNNELLCQKSCNNFLELTPESELTSRMFFFEGIGLENILIHGITSFLSHATYDSLSKPSGRRICSAKWVTSLAKRLIFLHLNGEFNEEYPIKSTFHSILCEEL